MGDNVRWLTCSGWTCAAGRQVGACPCPPNCSWMYLDVHPRAVRPACAAGKTGWVISGGCICYSCTTTCMVCALSTQETSYVSCPCTRCSTGSLWPWHGQPLVYATEAWWPGAVGWSMVAAPLLREDWGGYVNAVDRPPVQMHGSFVRATFAAHAFIVASRLRRRGYKAQHGA